MVTSLEFKQVLIKYLRLEDISPNEIDNNDPLFGDDGLGLDSVDSIELVLAIEKEYGIVIDDPKQYDTIFKNITNLLTYINEKK
ncbi:MAG: phosphopantetheine-binding protein [Campylobacterota bacterium]|nr:phosphopantetheine-binding protein [Campylobacterota bacterium]